MRALLIEDREVRQALFIEEKGDIFANYEEILYNAVGSRYSDICEHLKESDAVLDGYDLIIAHKSAFGVDNVEIIERLESFSKKRDVMLILFSGGVDTLYFKENLLEINSKKLYHDNLSLLLDSLKNGSINPYVLLYGEKWKLNIALNTLEKLSLFLNEMQQERVKMGKFQRVCKLSSLSEIMPHLSKYHDMPLITKDEIKKIKNDVRKYISKGLIYG